MKKFLTILLALVMMLALCSPAFAASLPELTFDLSCTGAEAHTRSSGCTENALEYVKNGDEITVYFSIYAGSKTRAGVVQDKVYYDPDFFELVYASKATEFSGYNATPQTTLDGRCLINFNTYTTYDYYSSDETQTPTWTIGSITLRVKATEGSSVITNESCLAAQNLDKYSISVHDLWVGFGEWDGLTYQVTLDANGGTLPSGASVNNSVNTEKGGKLTLPTPTKKFSTFDGWYTEDGQRCGATFTPTAHTTLTAHWTPVPAPAAPTGFGTVRASNQDAADGKITGVTTAMEYSASLQSRFTSCTGTTISGLRAGTYYIRLKENEAANQPTGEAAKVTVEAWPLREAPTGLSTVSASQPGAADGRIIGTTSQMEYSQTEDFASAVRCSDQGISALQAGTYYVRYVFDAALNRGAGAAAAVRVSAWSVREAPTGLSAMKTSLPNAADGKISGTTTDMEYSLTPDDAASFKSCPDKEMTGLKAGIYFVRYRFDDQSNRAAGKCAQIVIAAGNAPAQPQGLRAEAASAPDSKDGKITGVSAKMEYSTSPDFAAPIACANGAITGLAAGSYYIRVKAEPASNTPAGNYVLISVPAVPVKPTALISMKTSLPGSKDGKIIGVSSLMEYSETPNFAAATTCPDGEITGLAAGTYYIRVKADPATGTPAGNYATVEVKNGDAPVRKDKPKNAGDGSMDLTITAAIDEDAVATVSPVSDTQIKEAAAGETGVIGIDLSDGDEAVEAVKLPSGLIGKIAAAVKEHGKGGFALKLTSANLQFDAAALASLASQAGNGALQINMRDTGTMALNDAQYNAIREMNVYGGYSVSAEVGDKSISEFAGGSVHISIPFNVPTGRYAEGFSAYYVAPDGKLTKLATTYQGGMLSFTVQHFSDYIIAFSEQSSFSDVEPGSYYEEAVTWAVSQGITDGTSDTTFSPYASCTRAQVVTFLWRMAGQPTVDHAMRFRDVPASAYYTEAVRWAVSEKITDGTSQTTFSPDAVCTRAEVVTFLWRMMNKPTVDFAMRFRDVPTSAYYTEAVRWAVSEKITDGTSDTTFSPADFCLRAQVVTFLWRCKG